MIQAPANKIIVYPKTKYTKNITDLMKRAAIQNGATVDPSEVVNIVGEVVSVPLQISETKDYEGYTLNNIRVGDTAIFSYKVDNKYAPKFEGSIFYNDQFLDIDWEIKSSDIILSDKDSSILDSQSKMCNFLYNKCLEHLEKEYQLAKTNNVKYKYYSAYNIRNIAVETHNRNLFHDVMMKLIDCGFKITHVGTFYPRVYDECNLIFATRD